MVTRILLQQIIAAILYPSGWVTGQETLAESTTLLWEPIHIQLPWAISMVMVNRTWQSPILVTAVYLSVWEMALEVLAELLN